MTLWAEEIRLGWEGLFSQAWERPGRKEMNCPTGWEPPGCGCLMTGLNVPQVPAFSAGKPRSEGN
jgi:hypothetical protein